MSLKKWITLGTLAAGVAISLNASAATMVIDSLDGDITTNELNSFTTWLATQSAPTSNLGNAMADGYQGGDVEGMGLLYEATHQTSMLNTMISWCDTMMKYRNDQPAGEHRVMWDGVVEPVWPSKSTTDAEAGYAGCENGDVAGHIAYCAYLILSNQSLANQTVPDGNPNGYGATYKQRAQTYVSMLDSAMSAYFTHWFVNPTTYAFQTPTDPRWASKAGNETCTAWNRQMMFNNAYQRLAQCHDLLNDNPSFLATYKSIVAECLNSFAGSVYTYTASGQTVYDWRYAGNCTSLSGGEEVYGVHGEYDVWGLVRGYTSGYSGVTGAEVTNFANTMQYVVYQGADAFWSNVDSNNNGTGTYVNPGWIFLGQFDRPLFKEIAQAQIDSGKQKTWGLMDASILYMKHWLYINNFSGYYKILARHSGKAIVVQGGSTSNNAPVVQNTYSSSDTSMQWTLTSVGGDFYKILNRKSGKAMNVEGAGTANGTPVIQYTYAGSGNDEWEVVDIGGGYFKIINLNSLKTLDVAGASTADGATVDQYRWLGVNQEEFQILPAP